MSTTTAERIEQALANLDYPATKDSIVDYAKARQMDEDVYRQLRALPVATYQNTEEVLRSVPTDAEGERAQTMEEKANERRHHTKPGVAEHEKNVSQSPIEDVLGENRGS